MICTPRRVPAPPQPAVSVERDSPIFADAKIGTVPEQSVYDRAFWLAYAANALVVVAATLLYRYADFVFALGGSEWHLGWIVGIGTVGSLLVRLAFGQGIDRHGPGLVWIGSLAVFSIACFLHLAIGRCDGPAIYLVRILYACSVAGINGASTTFVASRVPVRRMAEMVGILGTSGCIGVTLGTQLGDLLCRGGGGREQVLRLFVLAGLLAMASAPLAWLATRGGPRPMFRRRTPLWGVLRRYQPGFLLVVGISAGVGVNLPEVFLRTFTVQRHIGGIGLYFGAFGVTTAIIRILFRRLPERIGLRAMILSGMTFLAVSMLMLLSVWRPWHLLLPGLCFGLAQAVLVPSMLAAISSSYPDRYRGLGMALALGVLDTGYLIGGPAIGVTLHYAHALGLPPYVTMFCLLSAALLAVTAVYAMRWPRAVVQTSAEPEAPTPGPRPHIGTAPSARVTAPAVGARCASAARASARG